MILTAPTDERQSTLRGLCQSLKTRVRTFIWETARAGGRPIYAATDSETMPPAPLEPMRRISPVTGAVEFEIAFPPWSLVGWVHGKLLDDHEGRPAIMTEGAIVRVERVAAKLKARTRPGRSSKPEGGHDAG